MPKVVKAFPQSHKRHKYDRFLDGRIWMLTLADAKALGAKHLGTIRNGIMQTARTKKLKLATSLKGDKLYVQATNGEHK